MADALQRETIDNFFEDWVSDVDYVRSNLAPSPAQLPEEQPERRREPGRRIRPLAPPKTKPARRRRDGSKAVFLLSALIFLVGSLGVITTYSDVYAKKAYIRDLNQELDEARQRTVILSEDPIQDVNMNELYRYATEELGMVEADRENTMFIAVQNPSYTEVMEPARKEEARVTFHWFS